ncbi:MAG: sigma-70 family RNA polymerase sigma factor [Pirellulaceae bacterium]|jgi:RNA polymerase sigma-70 factor (ECF subfamily)|nr:sigma-70 family RNA polymerase sigma factor [Pirellulaceae bacterium]MDP7018107.1 sigma-70 family RNA polymerase sigma factor [Pirellulaceae bacterium]
MSDYSDPSAGEPEEFDSGDFDAIVQRSHPRIRAYIAGMGIATHEVDDVAQDVYLEYYKNMAKKPAEVVPERWLKGIARNLCLNHIRKTARRGRLHREAITEMLCDAESSLERTSSQTPIHHALEGCFDKLPDDSRQLLSMKYEQDLSSKAMAAALASTAEAVRVALYRIRASLRNCVASALAQEGGA